MTPKIFTLLAVTLLSACGASAHSVAASSDPARVVGFQAATSELAVTTAAAPSAERSTANDYVVGPIVEPTEDGGPGVATYYIVRN